MKRFVWTCLFLAGCSQSTTEFDHAAFYHSWWCSERLAHADGPRDSLDIYMGDQFCISLDSLAKGLRLTGYEDGRRGTIDNVNFHCAAGMEIDILNPVTISNSNINGCWFNIKGHGSLIVAGRWYFESWADSASMVKHDSAERYSNWCYCNFDENKPGMPWCTRFTAQYCGVGTDTIYRNPEFDLDEWRRGGR